MITGGLIAIGILALIAAIILFRSKGKTGQTGQQAVLKRATDKQTPASVKPDSSAKAQASFPAPQVPFPVSSANKQTMTFAEPSAPTSTQASFFAPETSFSESSADNQTTIFSGSSAPTQAPFSMSETIYPGSSAGNQAVTFAEPSPSTPTQTSFSAPQVPFPGPLASFPGSTADSKMTTFAEPSPSAPSFFAPQIPFPGRQTSFSGSTTANNHTAVLAEPFRSTQTQEQPSSPVQSSPVTPIPGHKAELDETQRPANLNDQPPDSSLLETQTLLNIPSEVSPSPLNPASKSLRNSPSIEQQMAELIADTWTLQQEAAEIGRRLNYLRTCIQYSSASETQETNTDNNG